MGMGARGRRDYAQNATGMRKMVQGLEGARLGRLEPAAREGMIDDPAGKAKSIALNEEGLRECERLFDKHFSTDAL